MGMSSGSTQPPRRPPYSALVRPTNVAGRTQRRLRLTSPSPPPTSWWRRASRRIGHRTATLFKSGVWSRIGRLTAWIGAVGVAVGAFAGLAFTYLQYHVTQQTQITNQFTKAVEQLGSDKIDVRLGGIYSLERLARDSAKDQPTIIEILSAFVRTQAPADGEKCVMPELVRDENNPYFPWKFSGPLPELQVDVQAAVTVIGRRDPHHDGYSLPDLSNSCLADLHVQGSFAGANFESSKLAWALFDEADLRCAVFWRADLSLATFNDQHMNRADLFQAQAKGVHFAGADMRSAILAYADLESANFAGANLSRADLENALLTDANLRGVEDVSPDANLTGIYYNEATKWPAHYAPPASTQHDFEEFKEIMGNTRAECLRGAGS
jgi:hypothetical protein